MPNTLDAGRWKTTRRSADVPPCRNATPRHNARPPEPTPRTDHRTDHPGPAHGIRVIAHPIRVRPLTRPERVLGANPGPPRRIENIPVDCYESGRRLEFLHAQRALDIGGAALGNASRAMPRKPPRMRRSTILDVRMRDPRVARLAEVLLRDGYLAGELDAHDAAKRILAAVDQMSADDDERSISADAPESGGG
jgi:hypothetical protein